MEKNSVLCRGLTIPIEIFLGNSKRLIEYFQT